MQKLVGYFIYSFHYKFIVLLIYLPDCDKDHYCGWVQKMVWGIICKKILWNFEMSIPMIAEYLSFVLKGVLDITSYN